MCSDRLIAVLSDVHGNNFALRECIQDATRLADRGKQPLEFWFLGDVTNGLSGVKECMEQLSGLGQNLTELLLGNHDRAQLLWWFESEASLPLPLTVDNRRAVAQAAFKYIRDQEERDSLAEDIQPLMAVEEGDCKFWSRWKDSPTWASAAALPGVFLAHGLIVEANTRHYANTVSNLLDEKATDRLNLMANLLVNHGQTQPRLVIHGHTHLADLWRHPPDKVWEHLPPLISTGLEVDWCPLDAKSLWVFNVGAVGMQRDRRPGTAVYGLLQVAGSQVSDIALRRVSYDLSQALRHYRGNGSSTSVLKRLEQGY